MEKKILKLNGKIENIKISSGMWEKLHQNHKVKNGKVEPFYYSFNKEFKYFLNKYNLRTTYFNLNCLDELNGVVLTDIEIKKLKSLNSGEKCI